MMVSPRSPRFSSLAALCLGLAFSLLSFPVSAADYTREFQSENWAGGAMDVDGDGSADFCQSVSFADEGRYILVILYNKGVLFGLTEPAWRLVEDAAYPVSVAIDGASVPSTGYANDHESLLLALPYGEPLIDQLTEGAMLLVTGKMGSYQQSLDGFSEAFRSLKECYDADVAGLSPIPKPQPAPKLMHARMRKTSRESNSTLECGQGLIEEMAFSFPGEGGEVSNFSYHFSLQMQGFDTDECLTVEATGELESGTVTGNRVALNVIETTTTGERAQVTYEGVLRADGTAMLFDVTAPYEDLVFRVEGPE